MLTYLVVIAKEKEIARLLDVLRLDLEEKNLLPPREHSAPARLRRSIQLIVIERNATLAELKTHIRVAEDSGPLFTPEVSEHNVIRPSLANSGHPGRQNPS